MNRCLVCDKNKEIKNKLYEINICSRCRKLTFFKCLNESCLNLCYKEGIICKSCLMKNYFIHNKPWNFGLTGEDNLLFGIARTAEVKNKISLANTGKNNGMYGKPVSDKHKDTARRMCLKRTGKDNPNFGKNLSVEHKLKQSIAIRKTISEGRFNPIANFKNTKMFDTKGEKEVEKILKDAGITPYKQFRIKSFVYDFKFVVGGIKYLIEVDGTYWHGKLERKPEGIQKIVDKDRMKDFLAKENGYRLIRIWDDEINKVWRIV